MKLINFHTSLYTDKFIQQDLGAIQYENKESVVIAVNTNHTTALNYFLVDDAQHSHTTPLRLYPRPHESAVARQHSAMNVSHCAVNGYFQQESFLTFEISSIVIISPENLKAEITNELHIFSKHASP